MNRRRILLVAAVVVAALGTALVLLYAQGADDRAAAGYDTVDVLTATQPLEVGESFDDAMDAGKITTSQVTEDSLLPTAQSDGVALEGLFATSRIYPGEQLISEKFGGEQATSSALPIPRDKLAASVNLSDPARVAGFVNPGSEVAVVFSATTPADEGGGGGAAFSRVLLERVQVLGVGSTTPSATTTTSEDGAQTTEQLPTTLMTLSLDVEEVQRINFAENNGTLSFALLTEDSDVEDVGPTLFGNLFRD